MRKIINEGDGYKVRATAKKVGTFKVVAIDWEHPNYGYFADAMMWVRSSHLDKWKPIPIAGWTEKYKIVEDFLKDYLEFKDFFEFDEFEGIRKALAEDIRKY